MTLDTTKYSDYMRERWMTPEAVMQALIVNAPVLGMMKKKTDYGGKYIHVPLLRTGPQGRSATYATAKANAVGSQTVGFDVTYASNYQIGKLTGDVVDDSKGNENALYEAIDHEMDGAIENMRKDLRLQVFGNIGGARGQVASTSTVTLTLLNAEDSIHFEEGMEICAAATDGTSGSLRDSGQAITISKIDRVQGTLTADENWSEISGITANDYLFAEGDFGAKWAGLLSWIPASAPSGGESFFGVDRSYDVNRLSGIRYEGSGEPIEEAFINAAAQAMLYDAKMGVGVLNPIKWAQLEVSLGADRGNRVEILKDYTGRIGYKAIMLTTPMGDVPIVADPGCHNQYGLLLDMDTWEASSVGDLVHVIDDDGLTLRRGDADNWIFELKSRGNFTCKAPGKNTRIAFE